MRPATKKPNGIGFSRLKSVVPRPRWAWATGLTIVVLRSGRGARAVVAQGGGRGCDDPGIGWPRRYGDAQCEVRTTWPVPSSSTDHASIWGRNGFSYHSRSMQVPLHGVLA